MKHLLELLILSFAAYTSCAVVQRMISTRSGSEDLQSSATGYMYQSASGHPTSYVQFSSHPTVPVVPFYYVVPPQPQKHTNVVYNPAPIQEEPKVIQEEFEDIQEEDSAPIQEDDHESVQEEDDDGKAEEYQNEGGEEYNSASHSAHGEKGDKGYDNKHAFHKGVKGKHGSENNEGYYKENGGKKAGHHESAGHFNKHYAQGKGGKGEDYGEAKHHKKGQKTTGFHNVYHKDEYKKDHTFYDEADRSGHFNKHGDYNAHHSKAQGGHKKGGSSDGAYHSDKYGKKGSHDKGHYLKEDEGFNGKQGHDSHYATYSDYAKDGGNKGGVEFGYQDADGHGY